MDILDILLDILLKPPQPFIGLFLMLGLNNKIFTYVSKGASDSNTYIEFVHQAVNSYDTNGEPVLYPGCCIVADRVPIHGQCALWMLQPYLDELDIQQFYLLIVRVLTR